MQHSNNGSTSPHVACLLSAGGWQPAGTKNKSQWQMLFCRRMPRCMEWLWRQALLAQYAGYCVWGPVSFGSHHALNVILISSILTHLPQQGSTALPVPRSVMHLCTCTATAPTHTLSLIKKEKCTIGVLGKTELTPPYCIRAATG